MQALILAAGYGTRLGTLTLNTAKPLLDIAGEALLTHLARAIERVPSVETIHLITNAKFYDDFAAWRARSGSTRAINIVNDGTTRNEERFGAIGDLCLALEHNAIDDDVLIVGGDNLFKFDLNEFVESAQQRGTSLAVYTLPSPELASRYGNVELDADQRIIWFEEKPAQPRTPLIATCVYYLRREHIPRLMEYKERCGQMDAPGLFFRWLAQQTDVYGFAFDGLWFDIGDQQSLAAARAALSK